eukprot:scaffold6.g2700.t1
MASIVVLHVGSVRLGLLVLLAGLSAAQAQADGWRSVTTGGDHSCGAAIATRPACPGASWARAGVDYSAAPLEVLSPDGRPAPWLVARVGTAFSCGMQKDGTLYCWGRGSATPALVLGNYTQITALGDNACGRQVDASLWCWGDNSYGQLGSGTSDKSSSTPVRVKDPDAIGADGWIEVSAGVRHTCGVATQGQAGYCWGAADAIGPTLIDKTGDLPTPQPLTGQPGAQWLHIGAGQSNTCGVTTEGALICGDLQASTFAGQK